MKTEITILNQKDQMTPQTTYGTIPTNTTINLKHLFDAELEYDNSIPLVVGPEGREGEFLGNGKGVLTGEKIRGTIRFSFYSRNCAYLLVKGRTPPKGQHLCYTNPGGYITTEDGAEIRFDAKGYGLRGLNPDKPHLWVLTSALQFHSDNERYNWLNNKLGLWEGEFDERQAKAHYTAYFQDREFQSISSE